jgi:MerR family copper efflux transcriptional regulator
MRIGEIVDRSGVPAKTIRYYEDIEVLDRPRRTRSGYRDYDDAVLDRLRFVKAAQSVGLSLGEIREVLAMRDRGETPCGHVVELIGRRAKEIDAKIAELTSVRKDLVRLARRARSLDPKDCEPSRICHVIEPRRASKSRAGARRGPS